METYSGQAKCASASSAEANTWPPDGEHASATRSQNEKSCTLHCAAPGSPAAALPLAPVDRPPNPEPEPLPGPELPIGGGELGDRALLTPTIDCCCGGVCCSVCDGDWSRRTSASRRCEPSGPESQSNETIG